MKLRLLHATVRGLCGLGTCYLLSGGHPFLAGWVLAFGLSWVRD